MATTAKRRRIVDVARAAELQRVNVIDLRRQLPLATYAELAAAENGALD